MEKIVEGEIVGDQPRRNSFWQRGLRRIILGAGVMALGVGLMVFGLILTISIVGAFVGIPLMILGGAALVFGILILIGLGRVRVTAFRF